MTDLLHREIDFGWRKLTRFGKIFAISVFVLTGIAFGLLFRHEAAKAERGRIVMASLKYADSLDRRLALADRDAIRELAERIRTGPIANVFADVAKQRFPETADLNGEELVDWLDQHRFSLEFLADKGVFARPLYFPIVMK